GDRSVFHHRQEAVLLGPVEAMDLVDEEQRSPAVAAPGAGGVKQLPQILDAGVDRRGLFEVQPAFLAQQPGDRRLAGTRRPPQDDGSEPALRQHPGNDAIRPYEMILPHYLGQPPRAQAIRQRARGVTVEAGSFEQRTHGDNRTVPAQPLICISCTRPPRFTLMYQTSLGRLTSCCSSRTVATSTPCMATMTSPFRSRMRCAGPPCTSTITTPVSVEDSPSSSARAGERLATTAPANGWRPSSSAMSGSA